jgi:hypothetical protein
MDHDPDQMELAPDIRQLEPDRITSQLALRGREEYRIGEPYAPA